MINGKEILWLKSIFIFHVFYVGGPKINIDIRYWYLAVYNLKFCVHVDCIKISCSIWWFKYILKCIRMKNMKINNIICVSQKDF